MSRPLNRLAAALFVSLLTSPCFAQEDEARARARAFSQQLEEARGVEDARTSEASAERPEPERRQDLDDESAGDARVDEPPRYELPPQIVTPDKVPEELRDILRWCLERNPKDRVSLAELITRVKGELSAFLRSRDSHDDAQGRFSPMDAFHQIRQYLEAVHDKSVIPESRKQKLKSHLTSLKDMPGFSDSEKEQLRDLIESVGANAG